MMIRKEYLALLLFLFSSSFFFADSSFTTSFPVSIGSSTTCNMIFNFSEHVKYIQSGSTDEVIFDGLLINGEDFNLTSISLSTTSSIPSSISPSFLPSISPFGATPVEVTASSLQNLAPGNYYISVLASSAEGCVAYDSLLLVVVDTGSPIPVSCDVRLLSPSSGAVFNFSSSLLVPLSWHGYCPTGTSAVYDVFVNGELVSADVSDESFTFSVSYPAVYNWQVRMSCLDGSKQVCLDFSDVWWFWVKEEYLGNCSVFLFYPEDGATFSVAPNQRLTLPFFFAVGGPSSNYTCSFSIKNSTNTSVIQLSLSPYTPSSLSLSLSPSSYEWFVECSGDNEYCSSNQQHFIINTSTTVDINTSTTVDYPEVELISPLNGSKLNASSIVLVWKAKDNLTYQLNCSLSLFKNGSIFEKAGYFLRNPNEWMMLFSPFVLQPGTYEWQVCCKNDFGKEICSPLWLFFISLHSHKNNTTPLLPPDANQSQMLDIDGPLVVDCNDTIQLNVSYAESGLPAAGVSIFVQSSDGTLSLFTTDALGHIRFKPSVRGYYYYGSVILPVHRTTISFYLGCEGKMPLKQLTIPVVVKTPSLVRITSFVDNKPASVQLLVQTFNNRRYLLTNTSLSGVYVDYVNTSLLGKQNYTLIIQGDGILSARIEFLPMPLEKKKQEIFDLWFILVLLCIMLLLYGGKKIITAFFHRKARLITKKLKFNRKNRVKVEYDNGFPVKKSLVCIIYPSGFEVFTSTDEEGYFEFKAKEEGVYQVKIKGINIVNASFFIEKKE